MRDETAYQRRQRRRATKPGLSRGQKLWGWSKFILFALFLFFAVVLGGFIEFTRQVGAQARPDIVPKADGIVVWTGPGGGRLEAGATLLAAGHGERLLISGVNVQNSRDDISALLDLSEDTQSCCLDLDYAAIDTVGNARETSAWAQVLGYEHIILVTSDYHMPRAQVEISTAAGQLQITPYPVLSDRKGPWWKDRAQFDRLAQEYGKLLRTFLRKPRDRDANPNAGVSITPPPNPDAALSPNAEPDPDKENDPAVGQPQEPQE